MEILDSRIEFVLKRRLWIQWINLNLHLTVLHLISTVFDNELFRYFSIFCYRSNLFLSLKA